jgi:signal transduction histidine kinase
MAIDAEPPRPRSFRLRLGARLTIAMCLLLAALGVLLTTYVVPQTARSFARHGETLQQEGSAMVHEFARQQIDASRTVLVDLIRHTTAARQRAVQDQPLELHRDDIGAVRAAILAADQQRAAQQQRNVTVLADEMQRRADAQIDARLRQLAAAQQQRTSEFAAELRATHLTLVAIALSLSLLVLGAGLHFFVVRPTLRLRAAAQHIRSGNLAIELPTGATDELGDLARDFEQMAAQLRSSRAALQESAAGLEAEVQRKTAHLERTLTELRNSHQQLAQAERLAALGTLAGGIAHEFHNLIGGIRGCAAELLADEPAAERRETLAVITRAADRATGIVQQLLRFARHAVVPGADVDLAAVVEDALRLCEPGARRQGVVIERQLLPGCTVYADADALHQVFVNLLTNALQAMPGGGTLRATIAAEGEAVRVEIADSGVGIAAADLPHVFEPFFTTRSGEHDPGQRGTGLGLSVSYGIVTAHGGTLTATSRPAAGATFTVRLPRRATPRSAP